MFHPLLDILLGVFFGGISSLLLSRLIASRKLKRTERVAMFKIYFEILMKKQDRSYQYSTEIRHIIDAAHLAQMSKWAKKYSHNK